jgi:hypothetical protein
VGPGVVVGALGAALVGACGLVAAGGSPAAHLLVSVASATLALRLRLGTTLALAVVLSGAFALLAVSMRLWPLLGAPLTTMLVLPALIGAASLAVLWRRRTTALALSRSHLALGAALAAVSALQVLAVPVSRWLSDSPKLAWLMRNDNAWNFVSTRFFVEDGGLDAPGRSSLGPSDLLAHDLLRASEAILLSVAGASVLAGLLVATGMPESRRWSRAVLALVAAAVPWTWSLAGMVFSYGFWNSVPAAILLFSAWAAWSSSERLPTVSSAVLAVIGTALLAAWAPLVLVPAALGVAVVAWRWRAHVGLRGAALLGWLAPLVVLALYLALVTADDRAAASGGLSADGGFPAFGEHLPPVFWLVPLAVVLLLSSWSAARTDLVGVLVVGLAGAVGTYYLMEQRAGSPAGPWGYYPQKFAWTLSLLAPIVVLASVRGVLVKTGLARVQRATVVLGSALLAAVLLMQVPPFDPRPVSAIGYPIAHRTPDYRLSSLLPTLGVVMPDRASAMDPAAEALLEVEDADRKVVVSRWSPDPGVNALINFWLLQLPVDKDDEAPREYAYYLDSNDPAALCSLVRDWGGGVEILTRSNSLAREMRKNCADEDFSVSVR